MQPCLNLDDIFNDSAPPIEVRRNDSQYHVGPGGVSRPQFGTSEFRPKLDRLKFQRQKRKIRENFPDFAKYVSSKYHSSPCENPAPIKRHRAELQKSLYDTLQVEVDSAEEVIRTAFRKLSAKLHPDKGGSAAEFCELKRAYEVLSRAELRKVYDEEGLRGVEMLMEAESFN
jgi:hypothetical protein